jgi:two-component system copper resistance phosphate regulon response regulator CusR
MAPSKENSQPSSRIPTAEREGEVVRILVVEDDRKLAAGLKRGLAAERYDVDSAENGSIAIDLVKMHKYDLVILDLMLPGISGTEVLQCVRHINEAIPVLILTARGSVADKVKLFAIGADDYLVKPFVFAELAARVNALMRRGPAARSNTLTVGDLELNRLTQQVTRAGRCIDLTKKEYRLLEYLMLNAGRVLSRDMLVEHVWDHSFNGVCNIVEVLICQLREKINPDHNFDPIRTVRGTGYSIRAERS